MTTGLCSNPIKTDTSSCDDGNPCTQNDICQAGVCVAGLPLVCPASDDCHEAGACDMLTGACSDPAKLDGATCSLGTCQAGSCTPSPDAGPDGGAGGSGSSSTGGDPPAATIDLSCHFGAPRDLTPTSASWLGAIALLALRRRRTGLPRARPRCL